MGVASLLITEMLARINMRDEYGEEIDLCS